MSRGGLRRPPRTPRSLRGSESRSARSFGFWRPRIKSRVAALLLVAEAIVALLLVRNFFYVTTRRLYLDGEATQSSGGAGQRFELEGTRIVPQIRASGDERLRFAVRVERPSTLRFEARPVGSASYEVALVRGGERRALASGDGERAVSVSRPLPPCEGLIELSNHGAITWADLRIVRDLRFVPHLLALALLACLSLALPRVDPGFTVSRAGRQAALNVLLLGGTLFVGLAAAELALRAAGPRVGQGMAGQLVAKQFIGMLPHHRPGDARRERGGLRMGSLGFLFHGNSVVGLT